MFPINKLICSQSAKKILKNLVNLTEACKQHGMVLKAGGLFKYL